MPVELLRNAAADGVGRRASEDEKRAPLALHDRLGAEIVSGFANGRGELAVRPRACDQHRSEPPRDLVVAHASPPFCIPLRGVGGVIHLE